MSLTSAAASTVKPSHKTVQEQAPGDKLREAISSVEKLISTFEATTSHDKPIRAQAAPRPTKESTATELVSCSTLLLPKSGSRSASESEGFFQIGDTIYITDSDEEEFDHSNPKVPTVKKARMEASSRLETTFSEAMPTSKRSEARREASRVRERARKSTRLFLTELEIDTLTSFVDKIMASPKKGFGEIYRAFPMHDRVLLDSHIKEYRNAGETKATRFKCVSEHGGRLRLRRVDQAGRRKYFPAAAASAAPVGVTARDVNDYIQFFDKSSRTHASIPKAGSKRSRTKEVFDVDDDVAPGPDADLVTIAVSVLVSSSSKEAARARFIEISGGIPLEEALASPHLKAMYRTLSGK